MVAEVRETPDDAVDDRDQVLEVKVHVLLGLRRFRANLFRVVVPEA